MKSTNCKLLYLVIVGGKYLYKHLILVSVQTKPDRMHPTNIKHVLN